MATKKKVLLEQETPVPENTAPADGTISSAGPPADAAAPPDSDDLSALLASMDQTNDSASTDQPDGDATLEGSDPPLEFMETEASDEAAPEDDGTASGAPSDSDEPAGSAAGEDGDGEEETPSNLSAEGADGTPAEMVSETAVEPAPSKTKRAPRRKKAAPVEDPVHGENEDSAEAPAAEEQAVESSASVENTAPPDEGETPISEDTAPQEEAPVDTASALRRTAVTHRSDASILTIRSREEVETQEDREDVIWHEIHNAYRTRRILTGQLGGIEQLDNRKTVAVVDYKGFRIAACFISGVAVNFGIARSADFFNLVHHPFFKLHSIPNSWLERFPVDLRHHDLLDAAGSAVLFCKRKYISVPSPFCNRVGAAHRCIAIPRFSFVRLYIAVPLPLRVVCHKSKAMEEEFFFCQPFQNCQLCTGNFGIDTIFVNVSASIDNIVFCVVYISVIAQAIQRVLSTVKAIMSAVGLFRYIESHPELVTSANQAGKKSFICNHAAPPLTCLCHAEIQQR